MNWFAVCALVVCVVVTQTKALQCWTCNMSRSLDDCALNGKMKQCQANEESCQTVLGRYENNFLISKGCKQGMACRNNMMQNDQPSGMSTKCNSDAVDSKCHCCCDTDSCNDGEPTCFDFSSQPLPAENDDICRRQPTPFPHGKASCSGANTGAVCTYECTSANYTLHPAGSELQSCQKDGSWSLERPCCARPCPPYFLFDHALLMHLSEGELSAVTSLLEDGLKMTALAADAGQESMVYFSTNAQPSTAIKFNEYGHNTDRYIELMKERLTPVNDGAVNAGAAIKWALENLLSVNSGMRDHPRVPKYITIFTDRQPEDNVIEEANKARARGVLVYVFAYNLPGSNLVESELLKIAGNPDHLFMMNDLSAKSLEPVYEDMIKHFCSDPCIHVLHDHNF